MLPRNAQAIIDARAQGLKPAESVVVSFVGDTDFPGPHVYAEPATRYDWRFVTGLHVAIIVRPGIAAAHAMRSIFEVAMLYPTLIDIDRKQLAYIVEASPLKLWPRQFGGYDWQQVFG